MAKPFGISQVAINKMLMLQRKGNEFNGFVKGDDLFDLRIGDSNSVEPDVTIAREASKNKYEFDFHTHPLDGTSVPALPRKIARKEAKCSAELERARSHTMSPNDAVFAAEYRSIADTGGHEVKSLVIGPDKIIQYRLVDVPKYERYKALAGKKFGADGTTIKTTESQVLELLSDKWNLIDTKNRATAYEKQDFSTCGDRDRVVARRKEWFEFLESIGMEVKEENVKFVMPRKR